MASKKIPCYQSETSISIYLLPVPEELHEVGGRKF